MPKWKRYREGKLSVFSLNFSSAGKGPFLASKVKYTPEGHFPVGEGGCGVSDMALPSLGSSLKHHSLIVRPILCKSSADIFGRQFKTFDSNNSSLSSVFYFQNVWPIKRKARYTFVLSHFIHFPCDYQIRSQLLFLILVNLQALAGGKKC